VSNLNWNDELQKINRQNSDYLRGYSYGYNDGLNKGMEESIKLIKTLTRPIIIKVKQSDIQSNYPFI